MIDYTKISDLVEHAPIHNFTSGQIQSLNNLMINFDKEVIPYLMKDDDVDNYEEVIEEIIDMQNKFIDLYYKMYPPFRQEVDRLNAELQKELQRENKSKR